MMDPMDDLVQFLRARLDEDEQNARATVPGPWSWTPTQDVWGQCGPTLVHNPGDNETEVLAAVGHDAWGLDVADGAADHIARHNPARVLRQTAVLRDRVNLWSKMAGSHARACLRSLATIWEDHPDYCDEWRL